MKTIKKRASMTVCRAERGDMGGDYAFVVYSPFLLGVLMVGICFALIGFWRIGASYAAQHSAQVGAVNPGNATAARNAYFAAWTQASSAPSGSFGVDAPNRTTISAIATEKTFHYMDYFGPWNLQIGGQTMSRSERFYPGAPVCNGDGCDE